MSSTFIFFRPACLFDRHSPVRILSPRPFMLASRWVKISQCRFCGKVIFRHSGASINRWRFVRPKSSLIARIREEQSTWVFSTVPFNNDTRLKLTAIEKVLLDRDKHNTWIDDLLEKGGSLVTTGD